MLFNIIPMDPDIIYCILTHLSFYNIVNCSLINKQFNHASKNELLWKKLTENDYPVLPFPVLQNPVCEHEFVPRPYLHCADYLNKIDGYCKNYASYYKFNKFLECKSRPTFQGGVLDLSWKKLQTIPSEIGLLTDLKELYLHRNQLKSLPMELSKLTNLRRLDVDNNELETIPIELTLLTNLQCLFACRNHLDLIPQSLQRITTFVDGQKVD